MEIEWNARKRTVSFSVSNFASPSAINFSHPRSLRTMKNCRRIFTRSRSSLISRNFARWGTEKELSGRQFPRGRLCVSRVYLEAQSVSCARKRLHTRSSLRLSFVSADTPPPSTLASPATLPS